MKTISMEEKMKKRIYLKLIAFILIMTLTACGVAPSTQKENTSETKTSQNSGKDAGEYPMTFHNYGREVVIKEKPKKVLTLGPNCTELFVALGLTDYIVGNSLKNHSRGPLPEYAKEFDKIPELNYGSATREAVISSGADFIYGLDWEFGGDSLDPLELETYGMTTYMNKATSMEEIYQEILDIGKIFGITDKAKAYVEDQKSRISTVQEKIAEKEPLKVLIYDSGNDGVFTCSGENFESLLIQMAGGENIFHDINEKDWITVSYEEVLAREPDIIVIHDYDKPSLEEKIAEIKNNDILAKLDCVKKERFATITLESVLPGNRMAYTVEKLSQEFYPDLFQE
mgnify:FL=1